MKLIHSRKALVLGGLLLVTLTAGCAGGPGWSSSRYGNGGGGYGSAYPNRDGSAGSYPYNSAYARASPETSDYRSYYLYNNRGDSDNNGVRREEQNAEQRADLGNRSERNAVNDSRPVYR